MVLAMVPATVFAAGGVADEAALQAEIDAAPDGQRTTIRLDGSFQVSGTIEIGAGKDIVLDMNGMKITVTEGFTGRPFAIYGTLRVTGDGKIDTSASQTAYGSFDNYGTLYIENGEYLGYVFAGGSTVKNRPESYCEIYGGTFYGTGTSVYNEGITKIYGGTFDGRSCSSCSRNWGYTVQSHWNGVSEMPEFYFYNGTVIGVQGAFSTSAGYSEVHDGVFETVGCEEHGTGSA